MATSHDENILLSPRGRDAGVQASQECCRAFTVWDSLDIKGTLPAIKDYFAPLLPWEICAVQAQTSNGKTLFTNFWERQIVKQLEEQKRDEIIIHVSLEESIEAMAFQEYGRILEQQPANFARGNFTDWAKMQWAMGKIDQTPIWRIGDSS